MSGIWHNRCRIFGEILSIWHNLGARGGSRSRDPSPGVLDPGSASPDPGSGPKDPGSRIRYTISGVFAGSLGPRSWILDPGSGIWAQGPGIQLGLSLDPAWVPWDTSLAAHPDVLAAGPLQPACPAPRSVAGASQKVAFLGVGPKDTTVCDAPVHTRPGCCPRWPPRGPPLVGW